MNKEIIPNSEKQIATKPKRNSNIEWLRIISMLLIVAFHSTRNGYTNLEQPIQVYSTGIIFGSWGLLGVDLFLIISAWFLCSQKFRIEKVISLVFQTFTWVFGYSTIYVAIHGIYCHNGAGIIAKDVFLSVMSVAKRAWQPLWCNYYWFITAYFFLLLITPLLNQLLNSLSKSQLSKVLIILLFVPIYAQFNTSSICDVACFAYIYILVGYIKLHGSLIINRFAKARFWLLLLGIVVATKFIIYFTDSENLFNKYLHEILNCTIAATGRHSIIMLAISLLIFFSILNKPARNNNVVNKIASHTLGVYLFHEANFIGFTTLDKIFEKMTALGVLALDMWFPIRYLSIVFGVFAVGILLEWIRFTILQKPFMKWVTSKWSNKLEAVDNRFNSF